MSASQSAVSTSSGVGRHELPSLENLPEITTRMTTVCLVSSPSSIYSSDEMEELENDQSSGVSGASSMPGTPGLTWDSAPSTSELPAEGLKSVFEDWDDPEIPSSAVYVDEDGSQVLLLTPQSTFFQPPPTPPPFGHAPFSNGIFPDNDIAMAEQVITLSALSDSDVPRTPDTFENAEDGAMSGNGRILFVDTTYTSYNTEWSASVFFPPKLAEEAASWTPHDFVGGPDVPLDCIHSAGDISPVERWDEVCVVSKDMIPGTGELI
ncbi:hypothetical protein JR316_0002625 [Psilocybe cubensis]|uniref:Uncharacterized protein n=2 Tax=Psilocybe cubensis TaxID=181762 RepID=A0ACB8HDM2_PSICU|nr:hypothetical protein JR316_0002625 [Psilocybe cubensis]KAH9485712.1 hypothetical protein JR316_0002625 [Psilocybe cubensis]